MDTKELKVASLLKTDEVSLSKIFFNGSWKYLADPAAPLIYDLEYLLNISVEIVESKDYTELLVNGTFTGIGGQVIDGEADLGGDASYFIPEWVSAFTYLHPTHAESFYVYFKQPQSFGTYGLLLKPFSWQIWLSIIIMWILITSSVRLFRILQNFEDSNGNNNDIILWAIASICSRSYKFGHGVRYGIGMHILIICGILFGMLNLSIYSGLIISSLTVKTDSIVSFQDLIDKGYLILGRPEIIMMFRVFAKDSIEASELQDIARQHFKSVEDSVAEVICSDHFSPKVAYIEAYGLFYTMGRKLNYDETKMCEISHVQTVTKYPVAMFVRKQSNLKEILNRKTLLIGQTGLKYRYLKHSEDMTIPMCDRSNDLPQPLGLFNIRTVIRFIIGAYILAFLLLFIEAVMKTVLNK